MAELSDSVLMATAAIPAGRVATYGDVGKVVGCGPRLVARILAGSGGSTSWWRVVRADGSIAEQLVSEASTRLGREGVEVVGGRVDLAKHRAELE
ncbi:MAG: cysteine methyltransferase [Actinobacteria bacterium HGW-Actinobacteria-2]|nr:MAG: cysteine methyltransferase [Actinobacteria bacterium HGW-Actinobacteria-2]